MATDPMLRAARKYSVRTFPTIIVLDANGTQMERHTRLMGRDRVVSVLDTALQQVQSTEGGH